MKVTRVVIKTLTPRDLGTCATCNITLDDSLVIHQVKVVNGEKGLFVVFPTLNDAKEVKCKDGRRKRRYNDIVHPCDESLRKVIVDSVLKKYNDAVG